MTLRLAKHTEEIVPFLAMEVMERGMKMARAGQDIIQLGVGEPDFDAPPEVVKETLEALEAGRTHYTDSRGIFELREAVARDCEARRGVSVDPGRVIITSGTSPAIFMVMSLLLDPGDEVLMATPHYPCYPNMVRICGGRSVLVPTRPEDGYAIDVEAFRAAITKRTKAILVASPANPTGAVQSRAVMEGLASLGLPILSDEIYDGLVFGGDEVVSPLGMSEDCFVLDGFSKRYAMTGFRLGYVIAPEAALRPLVTTQQNLFISTAEFVQRAGVAALRDGQPHVERMREVYDRRRLLLVEGLRELGFDIPRTPTGAFYVLADARRWGQDSLALAFEILEKAGVACGPGVDFGEVAEGFLRFSYATNEGNIQEALDRLARVLPDLER